jgi:hypothetical protein
VVPFLDPLPRFEMSQPGNVLRIFERGGRFRPETGIPEQLEEPGKPRTRLSNRGLGTENRTDPVNVGLQKTRLLDPTLNFLGTNDHAGACDRLPLVQEKASEANSCSSFRHRSYRVREERILRRVAHLSV